jgi:ABC-2 type transport system ATP-binding protein
MDLVLDDVTKRYGQDAPVLDGLSHTFAAGTITGLAGPNGSGKTTLLRLLSALAFPTSGTIRHGDLDIHAHPYRYLRRVGVVHADDVLPDHLTAVELLAWVLRERDAWTDDAPDRLGALLDRLALDARRANRIGTYSSGMRKKTQIAAALVHDPAVLLMDEPLRSLDTATTNATLALIEAFRDDGGLVIMASHLGSTLDALADTHLVMGPDAADAEVVQAGEAATGEAAA